MKEIVLLLWSAIITSGYWAMIMFGVPAKDPPGIMVLTVVTTVTASIGLAIYLFGLILDRW
jgi:hypothetical protein